MAKGLRLPLIGACILANLALAADATLLPPWLSEVIERERNTPYPSPIEEWTLDGKLAYNIVIGTETYDLFSKDGEWLCRWGGYSGNAVMSGSCPGEKAFVRSIFPADTNASQKAEQSPANGWGLY